MAKRFAGLKSFGSKAVSVIASGALALSLTPAIALADPGLQAQSANLSVQAYAPNTTTNLHVISNDEEGDAIELVSQKNGEYVYKGYAHGDGSHYGSYSLYTHLITDGNGTLTGINLTSGVDTFYGRWGKRTYKNNPIKGYLPYGSTFSYDKGVPDNNGKTTVTATLKLPSTYGKNDMGTVTAAFYRGATAQSSGTAVTTKTDSDKGGGWNKGSGSTSGSGSSSSSGKGSGSSGKGSSGKGTTDSTAAEDYGTSISQTIFGSTLTVKASYTKPADKDNVNLIELTYPIGYDTKFVAYVCLDANAEAYANAQKAAEVDYKAEVSSSTIDGTGATNRDKWTYYMLSQFAQREVKGYAAYLANKSDANALAGIDVISGATKTTEPFKAAIEEAVSKGYIKSIAENPTFTIDAGTSNAKNISEQYSDQTTVVKNADGSRTIDVAIPTSSVYDSSDNHTVKIKYVMTYKLGKTLSSNDMSLFAKSAAKLSELGERGSLADQDNPTSFFDKSYTPFKIYGEGVAKKSSSAVNDSAVYNTAFTDTANKVKWELGKTTANSSVADAKYIHDYKLTVPADVSHVMVALQIGHAYGFAVYDVANMEQATTVSGQIAKLTASSSISDIQAARKAYAALPYDVQGFVTNLGDLIAAEKVTAGEKKTVSGQTYTVTKAAADNVVGTVTFTKAKNAKSVTVPATVTLEDGKTYKVTKVAAKAFTAKKIRSVTIGKNVTKIAAKAFKSSKATKVTVKSTSLKKSSVKNCFKGAKKMKTVKVPKKKLKAYKKIFTKKNTGSTKALKVKK